MTNYELISDMPKGNHTKLQTHEYDFKIKDISQEFREKYCNKTKEEKSGIILEFLKEKNRLPKAWRKPFKEGISMIEKNIGQQSNYDSTNDLYADDILVYLAEKYSKLKEEHKKDILPDITLQIADMRSGSCPQGRVVRLWQLVDCFN